MSLEPATLSESIKQWAREIGFDRAGIAPVSVGLGWDRLEAWLAAGRHGSMSYMANHAEARKDPSRVLEGARSVIVVARSYRGEDPSPGFADQGRVARYAWGRDYHDVLRRDLKRLGQRIEQAKPGIRWRAVVDSAPLMERDYARLAGLGWFGKNTLLLNSDLGSWFFLGAILVDQHLDSDQPFETDHCGQCVRCLEACPTGALVAPYELDARRCISYLTIEHPPTVDEELRPQMGQWIFGCDICQEVCPWNHRAPAHAPEDFSPAAGNYPTELAEILELDDHSFRRRTAGSALFRAGRRGLVRSALIAAANGNAKDLLPRIEALVEDADPEVAAVARWAIGRLGREAGSPVSHFTGGGPSGAVRPG